MTAMAKLQFCNFVQIFVAAREIHSYAPDMEIMEHLGILVTRRYFDSQKILTEIAAILL